MTCEEASKIADDFAYNQLGVSGRVTRTSGTRVEPGLMAARFADPDPAAHGGYWIFCYERNDHSDNCARSGLTQSVVVMEQTGLALTDADHSEYVLSNGSRFPKGR